MYTYYRLLMHPGIRNYIGKLQALKTTLVVGNKGH